MGGADFEADEHQDEAVTGSTADRAVDRSHNRDTMSSEAMTEMLRDLQDALLALDERLVVIETSQSSSSGDTRKLARGVAEMGDALARRVRALEQETREFPPVQPLFVAPPPAKPARTPPQNTLAWTIGLIFVLGAVLAGFWLLGAETNDRAAVAAPKPVVTALRPLTAPPPPVNDTMPASAPIQTHAAAHTGVAQHRWAPSHASSAATPPASSASPPATGFAHYGPTPPATAPAAAPASTPPPSRPPT